MKCDFKADFSEKKIEKNKINVKFCCIRSKDTLYCGYMPRIYKFIQF